MPALLIDTHAHLDYPEFDGDFDAILERARAAGIERILTIGTSLESSARAVALAEKYPQIYAVVGVHPTSEFQPDADITGPLRELAKNRRVVAIGETGLDYHRMPSVERRPRGSSPMAALTGEQATDIEDAIEDGAYKSAQASIFSQQLELAAELGLNVVIHQRDAWDDTLAILRNYTGKLRAQFHCFGGEIERAQEIIGLGHLISFTGIVTFKNAATVQQTAAQVAADAFMVETDCPYLAPEPHRGQRCEPAHTRLVAEKVAALRSVSLDEIARLTTATAERFFRF